jgi:hypothetical protein
MAHEGGVVDDENADGHGRGVSWQRGYAESSFVTAPEDAIRANGFTTKSRAPRLIASITIDCWPIAVSTTRAAGSILRISASLEAIHLRHRDVHQDRVVGSAASVGVDGQAAILRFDDHVAGLDEELDRAKSHECGIVDDERSSAFEIGLPSGLRARD